MNFCSWKLPNLLWIDTSGIKADTYVVVIVPDVYKHCIFYTILSLVKISKWTLFLVPKMSAYGKFHGNFKQKNLDLPCV